LYEGLTPREVELPIHVLASLGARTIIVTNASGGLNPTYHCGELMVIDDFIDLTFSRCGSDAPRRGGFRSTKMGQAGSSQLLSPELAKSAWTQGRRTGIRVHRGTYIGVLGPNYETRAEYRFLRRIGDAVGMSTVHEVRAAHQLGMQVLGLSVISNECRPDRPSKTTGQSVVRAVERASDGLSQVIVQTLTEL
jgi:purine-nucleoside phosphorylase